MPILFLWAALTLLGKPARPEPAALTTFPLRVSVATDVEAGWLAAQLANAATLYAPFGVAFAKTDGPHLDASVAHVETRADRDAFAARTAAHSIDVFVVASLRDVDDPGEMRRGVHWHVRHEADAGSRGAADVHYILLVGTAPPTVLAHELGHYFGNAHSPVADDVMSYVRTGGPVFFDAVQGRRIGERARAYVASGELLPR
ncbi:MAG TPA: hypothetical protein VIY73_23865 [Polyangiaceae bacterium]